VRTIFYQILHISQSNFSLLELFPLRIELTPKDVGEF